MSSTQGENFKFPEKGKVLSAKDGAKKAVIDFVKKAMDGNCFDAVLLPVRVHDSPHHAWVFLQDKSLLDKADPFPPVMSIQGGRALSSLTKHGEAFSRIAVILRPCEIRASIELFKLNQINLENIFLISFDCPGVMPLKDYVADPDKVEKQYEKVFDKWGMDSSLRPACQNCTKFSLPHSDTDLHIGLLGASKDKIVLVPASDKGKEILEKLDYKEEDSLQSWSSKVKEIEKEKIKQRKEFNTKFKSGVEGREKLLNFLNKCINCHNCMRVCPICYCQHCYLDSGALGFSPETYIKRAESRGSIRFPLDTLLFHLDRMSHMVLSCVSCGACEDACPASIRISQLFSFVGEKTQDAFGYSPGKNKEEPLPLQDYMEDEFHEVETPSEESVGGEVG